MMLFSDVEVLVLRKKDSAQPEFPVCVAQFRKRIFKVDNRLDWSAGLSRCFLDEILHLEVVRAESFHNKESILKYFTDRAKITFLQEWEQLINN